MSTSPVLKISAPIGEMCLFPVFLGKVMTVRPTTDDGPTDCTFQSKRKVMAEMKKFLKLRDYLSNCFC